MPRHSIAAAGLMGVFSAIIRTAARVNVDQAPVVQSGDLSTPATMGSGGRCSAHRDHDAVGVFQRGGRHYYAVAVLWVGKSAYTGGVPRASRLLLSFVFSVSFLWWSNAWRASRGGGKPTALLFGGQCQSSLQFLPRRIGTHIPVRAYYDKGRRPKKGRATRACLSTSRSAGLDRRRPRPHNVTRWPRARGASWDRPQPKMRQPVPVLSSRRYNSSSNVRTSGCGNTGPPTSGEKRPASGPRL